MFIARSLKGSLPAVVIIVLIGYGAVYAINQTTLMQVRLREAVAQKSEAEIRKAQAEADAKVAENLAKVAGTAAKYEAEKEYSNRLANLNTVSMDVLKRLQDLVSGQLNNIKEANNQRDIQDNRARENQEQILQAKSAELEALHKQIAEAKEKYQASELAAALSSYKDVKGSIASQLGKDYGSVSDQLLEMLGRRLQDPVVETQAKKDAAEPSERWDLRVALYLQLFQKTSNAGYVESARLLTVQNKRQAPSQLADLFGTRYGAFSDQQMRIVLPVVATLANDPGFTKDFRDRLLSALSYPLHFQVSEVLEPEVVTKLAQYAGANLIEKAGGGQYSGCGTVMSLLQVLAVLSPDAQLVYAARALRNPGGSDSTDKQCIKSELEKAVNGRVPSNEMIQRWTGTTSESGA